MEINETLKRLLVQLQPSRLRIATREISVHLRRSNRQRITQQKNAAGEKYTARKDSQNKAKMLQGFKPHLLSKNTSNTATVGIFGRAAKLAAIHNNGQIESGIEYAERQLVGISADDVKAIEGILIKHINA